MSCFKFTLKKKKTKTIDKREINDDFKDNIFFFFYFLFVVVVIKFVYLIRIV